jgi:subtilisin family serine protease
MKIIGLLACILLLASNFPVLAQDVSPSATPSDSITSQTVEPIPDTPTETPTEIITPEPQPTSTLEPYPIFTATETSTPVPTPTPRPTAKPVSCDMDGVYRTQIIVGYRVPNFPDLSFGYTLVDSYPGTDGIQISVLQVDGKDFCSALKELQESPDTDFAEPNYTVSLLNTYPNDPELSKQYYLNNILAPQGWDYTTGSVAVTIAVLDTGIDSNHVDLSGKLLDPHDFLENDNVPQDPNGHGTLVAGIAAAKTNNGLGVAGVSWGAQIMPLRILDAAGNGSNENVAQAILWATNHGARVINMSFGGPDFSQDVQDAVNYALEQGVVLVAATGNQGVATVLYPAAYPGVIGVGATDSSNLLADFSNTGDGVDVVAPGVAIYSTSPGSHYSYSSGTSMAAPQVSGLAALLASLPGMYYSSRIVNAIESNALDLGDPGWDPQFGYGLIQVGPAVLSVVNQYGTATPTSTPVTPAPPPTATRVVIFEPQHPYQTPTPIPTSPILNGQTAIPGEVSIQQIGTPSPTFQIQGSITPVLGSQGVSFSTNAPGGNNWFFILPFGLLCILVGVIFFIYSRKKYKK